MLDSCLARSRRDGALICRYRWWCCWSDSSACYKVRLTPRRAQSCLITVDDRLMAGDADCCVRSQTAAILSSYARRNIPIMAPHCCRASSRGPCRIMVLEAEPTIGGWLSSVRSDGFLFERGCRGIRCASCLRNVICNMCCCVSSILRALRLPFCSPQAIRARSRRT